jgi:protein-disulfide isomerase
MSKRTSQKHAARVLREQLAREQRRKRTLWTAIVAVAGLVLAGLIGYGVYAAQKPSDFNTPRHAASGDTGIADGAGPVTVDIYLDFMCPVCKSFEQEAGQTLRKLADDNRATVIYHPMAILDRASTTQYSTRSAASSGCAADQDKFIEYAEALFTRQPAEGGPGLDDDTLIQVAGSVGIADPAYARCVRDGTYTSWVRHVTDGASQRGVTGTPTVYVAGQQIARPSAAAITAAVEAARK